MQTQKDAALRVKSDVFLAHKAFAHRNAAELRHLAMHRVQLGHAARPIASQLQHCYLPIIEGK